MIRSITTSGYRPQILENIRPNIQPKLATDRTPNKQQTPASKTSINIASPNENDKRSTQFHSVDSMALYDLLGQMGGIDKDFNSRKGNFINTVA